jgi:hypothetical protein
LIAASIALAACSSGGTFYGSTDDGGPSDDLTQAPGQDLAGPRDLRMPPDLVVVPTFACGDTSCPIGTKCCITGTGSNVQMSCMSSCPAGVLSVECDGPSACGGNPCCAPFKSSNGSPQAQNVTCGTSPSDCVPMVDIVSQSGVSRLCHADADCTSGAPGSQLTQCCTGTIANQSTHFCFNSAYLAFVSGVTCP